MKYDLLLKGGRLVDPKNGVDKLLDIGIKGGKVEDVGEDLDPSCAMECFDIRGLVVIPGVIDMHVHVSEWIGGRLGHKMMAQAGVTTAVDLSGPIDGVLAIAKDYGAGLNIACLHYVRPGHTVSSDNPSKEELKQLVNEVMEKGALGYKILGGHYPLTSEATARAIEVANEQKAYVAFHAGTKAHGSNIDGFIEAVELAGKNRLHLAHINSYCRGQIMPTLEETQKAIDLLEAHKNIITESYLSSLNGTSSQCSGGVPESAVTRKCLEVGGFEPTEKGFEEAIRAGWALINAERGGVNILLSGEEGVNYWRERNTLGTVSFRVNPGESRYLLATAKRKDASFVIDAISTDGGGIPRNATVELGLWLVHWGGITLAEFVQKASVNPAAILGLSTKGYLAPGADADVTVVDLECCKPYLAIANGKLIMYRGAVVGRSAIIITTEKGRTAVESLGFQPCIVDLEQSGFYKMRVGGC